MMNRIKFLAAVCCMLAVFTACENSEPIDNSNGINTDQNGGNSNTGSDNATGTANGHGYVDLGLSVKWATCNVGATKPEEYGDYFAWGETEPKTTYDWSTYKWATATQKKWGWDLETLTKYNTVDNKTALDLEDDAARANWGDSWRMPTDAELAELYEKCTWKWTDDYNGTGVAGQIVTGLNSNSIFLPAAGKREDILINAGFLGVYYSSNLRNNLEVANVIFQRFFLGEVVGDNLRVCGVPVRPVIEYSNGINTDQNEGSSNTDNSSGSISEPTGTENGYGYVDLGLPSGLKWATCNVGATAPEEYGNHYAWGETEPKTTYDWSTYKWATATQEKWGWDLETLTKYNTSSERGTVDNKTVLDPEDDAAHVNWGGAWRMPTRAEWLELYENCIWKGTDDYNGTGVAGQIVTGFNGNSIFLPVAGNRATQDNERDYIGYYWSSSLDMGEALDLEKEIREPNENRAWDMSFKSQRYRGWGYGSRCNGNSVRPVTK